MINQQYKQTEIGEIPGNWSLKPFREVAYLSKDIFDPKKAGYGKSYAYLGLEHFCEGGFALNGIGQSDKIQSNKFRFVSGDILFGKLRPYFKKVYSPKFDGVCSTDIWVVKAKQGIDQKFLYFLVGSNTFLNKAVESSEGTKMPRASWDFIANYKFPIPSSINEQRQIASILSSLDDKIELNKQMNKTLEQIGKALFKRWFVDFEFPFDFTSTTLSVNAQGKPNEQGKPYKSSGGKMVDSELGEIPEGWEVKDLDSISEIKNGFAFKSEDYTDEGVFLLRTRNFSQSKYIIKDEVVFLPERFYEDYKNFQLRKFDVLLVMVGASVGCLGFVTSHVLPALQNQNMWNFRARETQNQLFLKFLVERIVKENIGSASGSARDFFRKDFFRTIKFACPSNEILESFNKVVLPMFEILDKNLKEIEGLSQIRDSLLPRLMSGRLRVKN